MAVIQHPFDFRTHVLASSAQLPGNCRFVLTKQTTDLCELELLDVVTAQPEAVARVQV